MKKKLPSLCLALVLCLGLAVPVMAAEQKITVNGETYAQILPALLSQTEDKPVTLRLDTDIQLTNFRIVLGSSDYGGLFGGQVFTVVPHDVTIDLNGHTLRGEEGYSVFEVQNGYILTIVDSSAVKTGKLVSQTDVVVDVADGGSYTGLPTAPDASSDSSAGTAPVASGSGNDDDEDAKSVTTAFTDVDPGMYYAQPVAWAVEEGITNGTTATTFSPYQTCTRAQIVTFLWRAAGQPEPKLTEAQYMDVTDTSVYYYKAIQWAAEMGMEGSGTFRPSEPCTRFDAVYFLWCAAGQPEPETEAAFTDLAEEENIDLIHPIASVSWAVEKSITKGTTATTFSPMDTCTRGQIVTFLYRGFAE